MNLKPEVTRILVREKMVSETALARLREKTRPLELQYGWSTDTFLKKFNAGEAGDEKRYFVGMRWQKRSRIGRRPAIAWTSCWLARS